MIGINNYSRILIWVELFRSLIFSWHLTYVLFLISFTKKTLLLTLNPHSVKLILLLFPYGDNIIHLIKYIMVVFQALFVFRESGNFKNLHVKTMMSRTQCSIARKFRARKRFSCPTKDKYFGQKRPLWELWEIFKTLRKGGHVVGDCKGRDTVL